MKRVIEELERLCVLHEHLLSLSEQKTEALKTNEIKALSEIVTKEQKYVQAIEQTEQSALKQLKAVSAARTRPSAHVSAELRAARKRCWNSCMPSSHSSSSV